MSQGTDLGEGRKVPGFAKGIMALQTLLILFLSSWIVEEYMNNIYLQAYVNNTFQAYGSIIAILTIVSVLGVAFVLFKVLKSTHRQIGALNNEPESAILGVTGGNVPVAIPRPKPDTDLHPMVAALKADLAHQSSMQPIPPIEVKDVAPTPSAQTFVPPPPQPKPMIGTPSTVITGTMPVLKRVNTDRDKNQNSRQ